MDIRGGVYNSRDAWRQLVNKEHLLSEGSELVYILSTLLNSVLNGFLFLKRFVRDKKVFDQWV